MKPLGLTARVPLAPQRAMAVVVTWLALTAALPAPAVAQAIPSDGRLSLFASWAQRDLTSGDSVDSLELVTTLSLGSTGDGSPFEYGLDVRLATYPSEERDERVSIYQAWLGAHTGSDRWALRLGQMWLRELGGIGAVAGVVGELRLPEPSAAGSWRFGLFAGLEPLAWELGFVDGVSKGGGYAVLDGAHGRQHVLGYVLVQHDGTTERSVVAFNNFLPIGRKFFVYQALEYDTQGPAGVGSAELSYFLANLRYAPTAAIDLQATYHRGVSVDARAITDTVLDGRPVPQELLDGLRFESARLRVTVRPWRSVTLWGGYGQDRDDSGDDPRDTFHFGVSAYDLLGSGLDLTLGATRHDDGDDSVDALNGSLGAALGRQLYLTLDYHEDLARYRATGGTIEARPDSSRWALSSNLNFSRRWSLLVTVELVTDGELDERRVLSGVVLRF